MHVILYLFFNFAIPHFYVKMAFLTNRVKSCCEKKLEMCGRNVQPLNKSNVRVLLFKESGHKGRTVLFDSSLIENLSRGMSDAIQLKSPTINLHAIPEMVFGSLTLRCHDTYFRIHNLSSPNRIMFTQVFPLPCSRKIKLCSLHPHLPPTVKNSDVFYLGTANCDTNLGDGSVLLELGITGTPSNSDLFGGQCNTPNSSTSTIDSGYAEQSFCSFTISNKNSFNSGTSLNCGQNEMHKTETRMFLTEPNLNTHHSNEVCSNKTSATLGLVIILGITADKEEYIRNYMKHIAFIESIIFRIRRNIELAINKPAVLLSTMVEITQESTQWLSRMFPGLQRYNNYETNVKNCRNSKEMYKDPLKSKLTSLLAKMHHSKLPIFTNSLLKNRRYEEHTTVFSESDKCYTEFCELLAELENKETNFFISTVVTATLTYHLGWISTCNPFPPPDNTESSTSYNSLWRQVAELCGAQGSSTKSAQTIINGSNQNEMVAKVLKFIKYFVRYPTVVHNSLERINIVTDNEQADRICFNYKHSANNLKGSSQLKCSTTEMKSTLRKSKACSSNLSEFITNEDEHQEIDLLQEEKVTFLLGENEELVNIKPIKIKINGAETIEPTSKKCYSMKHSKSCPVLYYSNESSKQTKYSKEIRKSKYKRCKSESNIKQKEAANAEMKNTKSNEECKYSFNTADEIHSPLSYQISNKDELSINGKQETHKSTRMKIINFPLPSFKINDTFKTSFASSLKSDKVGTYVPDMVIQGTNKPQKEWLLKLKRDLCLTRQIYFFDGYVDESVAVVGDVDNWNVEIVSSRGSINKSTAGMRLDISSLVENMLEVLLQMWNLNFCKEYSATHIEQRLLEICLRSYAFGQLLMHTDMCTMDLLTTTLHLEVNDIPLLMAVASIITPEVTKKYGISFQ